MKSGWLRRRAAGRHLIPVVQAYVDYKAPAQFGEVLVKTRIAHIGNSSIRFENEIHKLPGMELLATGHTVHVLTDRVGKKIPFTAEEKERLTSS